MIAAMLASLARAERTRTGELRAYQERRRWALVHWAARRTTFYRRWFAEAGDDPAKIRTLADLGCLPLIDRTYLAAERPDDFLAYPRRAVLPAHSSGTSGTPVTAYRTAGSSMFELAALQRLRSRFGLPFGTPAMEFRGSTFAGNALSVLAVRNPGADRRLISSVRLSKRFFPAIRRDITDYGPAVVEGWPWSMALPAALIRDAGLTLPVRGVITSSEPISPAQLALMRQVYVVPVIDHYGQIECVVMAGGCEGVGYHLFPDYRIMELLPAPSNLPGAGGRARTRATEPGMGFVVGTSFDNKACPSSTTARAMSRCSRHRGHGAATACDRIVGRLQEFVVCRDHCLVSITAIGAAHFTEMALGDTIQYEQLEPGRLLLRLAAEERLDEAVQRPIAAAIERKVPGRLRGGSGSGRASSPLRTARRT